MFGKNFLFSSVLCATLTLAVPALAQQKAGEPPLPKPLQTLAQEGAQIRFMGNEYGMNAWLTIQKGQEQYFYTTPKGDAMIMGLMFETETGKLVTMDQIRKLQEESGNVLSLFSEPLPEEEKVDLAVDALKVKSPAEKMYEDVESANYISFGKKEAPIVYAFIDPQCPYCHAFVQDLRANYLPNGLVQLRMIPVGFKEETLAQSAFLLGAPDADTRFLRHLDGDKMALPISYDINQQGVERNMAIMQSWKLNVTPLIVYRSGKGDVKIIQGRAKDLPGMVKDLTTKF